MSEAPVQADGGELALRLPDPVRLFDLRSVRLAALAPAHAMPDWVRLVSRIAAGQAAAVRELRPGAPAPRGGGAREVSRAGCPLPHGALPRDETWRRMLAVIVASASAPGLPAATRDTLGLLAASDAVDLERLAGAVLAGDVPRERIAVVPFVGAALQAWLAALAAGLDPASTGAAEGACPVCGGPPLAGRVRRNDRRRDVTCALCASEWNVPRVRCAVCDTSASPEYFHVDAEPGVKAEACPTCRSYLKLFDEEKRPGADPAADDAATLTLDLLLAEEGYHRAGPNLYVGL